jgi:hypothetical protein
MKNMIIIGSMLLFTGTTAFAQSEVALSLPNEIILHKIAKSAKEEAKEMKKEKVFLGPSYSTEQQFLTDFPGATDVTWRREGIEQANFILDGKRMNAYYDYSSELIGTTTGATYDELPAEAKKFIEKHFSDYKPQQVILFDDNEYNDSDLEFYGNPFQDADNYFAELSNNNKTIVLQISKDGFVSFFEDITYRNVK